MIIWSGRAWRTKDEFPRLHWLPWLLCSLTLIASSHDPEQQSMSSLSSSLCHPVTVWISTKNNYTRVWREWSPALTSLAGPQPEHQHIHQPQLYTCWSYALSITFISWPWQYVVWLGIKDMLTATWFEGMAPADGWHESVREIIAATFLKNSGNMMVCYVQ